ncbi:MAG: imelysin family protein [Crocinitomicaceae bacterium]
MNIKSLFLLGTVSFIVFACNKDEDKEEFDRGAMLTNMASAVIEPSYTEMNNQLISLHSSAVDFTASPTAASLNVLKDGFVSAYLSFQHCKMYNFGPMMDYGVKNAMNTYPADTAIIESNISSGSYTLGSVSNITAIGLPAIDYLLYTSDEVTVLNSFTVDANAGNRKTYLTDITQKMKEEYALAVSAWSNYKADFIAADGNDVSSSTTLLFNEFVKDIELLKNAKIGIPAGYKSGGQVLPDYVEGYYSQISILLAKESIVGLTNAFNGGTGLGFDDYIKDVEGEEVSPSLVDNINAQFTLCDQKVSAIGTPLSEKVNTNSTAVSEAYAEIKKLVTYCKTDMSSTLGLLITYQDNDGD